MGHLVLTRRLHESVQIGTGPNAITVTVADVDRGKIRLMFTAPMDVPIVRTELLEQDDCGTCGGGGCPECCPGLEGAPD